jgi:hypothetical protein
MGEAGKRSTSQKSGRSEACYSGMVVWPLIGEQTTL